MGACAVWFYLAMLGTKRECVRVAKHHLFGHSLKGASFLFQHFGQADAVGICCRAAHWVVPPFLNGRAVFANKHALALAHASRGGKCKRWGSPPLKRSDQRSGGGVAQRRSAQAAARKIGVPLVARQGRSPSAGLVSLHQREAQRLLWQFFFGWTLRAGIGRAEAGGAETFVDAGRLMRTDLDGDPRMGL